MVCNKCGKLFLPTKSFCPFCGELNTDIHLNKKLLRMPASDYEAPAFSIVMHKEIFPDPESGYDEKADEFFKPEPTAEEKRQFEENLKSKKKKVMRWLIPAAVLSVMIICLAIYSIGIAFSNNEISIVGTWKASTSTAAKSGSTYSFTNDGFVTVQKTVDGIVKSYKYSWRIDEINLAVDNITYKWNENLNSYHNAKDGEHFWFIKDSLLYLSSDEETTGYKVLTLVN